VITADLLRAAGMTMTGVGIDELDHALTTGPPHGRDNAQAAARIEFTAAGASQPRRPSSPERAAATSAPRLVTPVLQAPAGPPGGSLTTALPRPDAWLTTDQ
jgi:hypothetical protein